MKKLVIFDTYPSGQKEIEILNRAIGSFAHPDWDLMIVSHLSIDRETANKVQYTIYDSNNLFLPSHLTPYWWMDHSGFNVKIFNNGHSLAITRNMNTSLHLAKALGYQQFVFTESDVVLHPEDLQKLHGYIDKMVEENKKMVFFKPDEYRDCGSHVYETLLFGGDVNYFLDTFIPPKNIEEWYSMAMGYTLELSIYEKFCNKEDEYVILNDHSSRIFDKSDVNLLRYGLFNCEMVYNETYPDEPALFVTNSLIIDECRFIEVYKNEELIHSVHVCKSGYWFNTFKIDGSTIKVNVFNSDKSYLYFTKTYTLTEDNNFKTKGVIKFN